MNNRLYKGALGCALLLILATGKTVAHGFAGDRFFPPTITSDDPFATDELALPTVQYNPAALSHELDVSGSFTKEIFPHLAFSVEGTYQNFNPRGGPSQDGFDNISLNLKYQLYTNAEHEFLCAVGADADLGGTGSPGLLVDTYTTYTPKIYFGKGFNELPNELRFLRPFALTGEVGLSIPGVSTNGDGSTNSDALVWQGALEYSIPYLQQHVEDLDIPRPFRDMIPLVEFSLNSPLDRAGQTTTGTINPGVLWESKDFQIGVEAVIPVNSHTGPEVGGVFQVQWYIDDMFPNVFGHPVFFGDKPQNH